MQKEEKQQTTIIFDDSSSIQTDATTKAASNIRSRKVFQYKKYGLSLS